MAVVYCTVCAVFAHRAPAPPAFDVAYVKRIVGPSGGIRQDVRPDSLSLRGVTLGYSIRWAYGIGPYQTYRTAGPDWIDPPHAEFYDIEAKTGGPMPVDQLRLMLQTLLADRFKLVLHRENKVFSVLAVVVRKDGPKLKESAGQGDGEGQMKPHGINVFDFEGAPMARLIDLLDGMTRLPNEPRPVVDETGLTGTYDFTLDLQKYRELDSSGAPVLDERGRVDMESVVRRALPDLGLRLESKRAPVEVLVIDHVEKEPTAN
jgi:uncharacterized protein (TIGR03435 family)